MVTSGSVAVVGRTVAPPTTMKPLRFPISTFGRHAEMLAT